MLDKANELGSRGRFSDAIDVLQNLLADCDGSSFSESNLCLDAQERMIDFLGLYGLKRYEVALDWFSAVQMDFDAFGRRSDYPAPEDEQNAKLRYCRVARNQVRILYELGRFTEGLEAVEHANRITSTLAEGIESDEQRAHLMIECAGILLRLSREEDAKELIQNVVDIIRRRYSMAVAEPEYLQVASLGKISGIAQDLLSRMNDLACFEESRELAAQCLAAQSRIVKSEPHLAGHRMDLARTNETLGLACCRLDDPDGWEHLETAAEIYKNQSESGDIEATIRLAHIQREIGDLPSLGGLEKSYSALRESMRLYRMLWLDDKCSFGPRYLDVLQKFCSVTDNDVRLGPERQHALVEAGAVIKGFDPHQTNECSDLISWCHLNHGRVLSSGSMSQLREADAVLGKALVALRQSEAAGKDIARALQEVRELRASITLRIRRTRTSAAKFRDRKRVRFRMIVFLFAGISLLGGLGLLISLVLPRSDGMQCAVIEHDIDGEEICARWENRAGVHTNVLPPVR